MLLTDGSSKATFGRRWRENREGDTGGGRGSAECVQ